ncbi:MAG: RNA polymerase sigma-54 factor [Marinilabiliales bacterium]|jgi:RNA polymerase sigma-54 factor|nr:MAG: RNA polymerase sigma-54 factor [Marinilabiliales bacterium]
MLNQRLQQKLLQKLSPQQILLMKLLQVPAVGLEQRIKQEIEENPALEVENEEAEEQSRDEDQDKEEDEDYDGDDEITVDKEEEFSLDDYMQDEDDTPLYKLKTNNYSADDEHREMPVVSSFSFHEILTQQLGLRHLGEHKFKIGQYIIGNIDDSGYLERSTDSIVDDLAFTQNFTATKKEVEEILGVIQELDPAGVGARNLQECLLIQLRRKQKELPSARIELAIKIINRFFNEFTKKHYSKIMKRAEISEEQLKEAIDEILTLNPKPGNSLSESTKTNHYIIPDFTIRNTSGTLELSLNSWNTPDLRVSSTYAGMINDLSKQKRSKKQREAYSFIKQKVDSAKWFIEAIRQRQNTLYTTMEAIMNYQYEYFKTGDETLLKPMILKDIAEMVHLDISTISRVANSKYVQTAFGTFLLKSFFSESMQNDDGEEVSTREIKTILKQIIEAEDKAKPLTDEHLTKLLKEKGYPIARRTVAKYREQLSIPVARLRKEL